jgi:hypothetical protein
LSDNFSARRPAISGDARTSSKLAAACRKGHDTKVSWLTGKALSHKANIVASKSYNTQGDYRFDMKTFMELRNARSVVIAYDGLNPTPPMFCYLKTHHNNPNDSYFARLAKGRLW